MRIFLDVGAHMGSTARAVLDPKYRFDRVVCFEPARACWEVLSTIRDSRVQVIPFGLWSRTCEIPIHDPGSIGASIFPEKARTSAKETCRLVRASAWFRENIPHGAVVYLKLNVEGAECDIVEDLLESGEYRKVTFAMVDLDTVKIPGREHRARELREKLEAAGASNFLLYVPGSAPSHHVRERAKSSARRCASYVIHGPPHQRATHDWLDWGGAAKGCSLGVRVRQLAYVARQGTLRALSLVTTRRPAQRLFRRLPSSAQSRIRQAWRAAKGER